MRCEAGGPAGVLAASIESLCKGERGRPGRKGDRPGAENPLPAEHTPMGGGGLWPVGLLALRLDRLVELQLAVDDLVRAVVGERGVAVLVDRVRAEHALAVLGGEQRLDDVLLR